MNVYKSLSGKINKFSQEGGDSFATHTFKET